MVKVRGPMFSLAASGSLGDAVTFSKWKGRPYVREKVVPANPKSGLQTGFRSMFGFLSKQWNAITTIHKATWDDLADVLVASSFNAYQKANQQTWRNYVSPTMMYPATATGDVLTFTTPPAATAGVDSIDIDWVVSSPEDGWGMVIFRAGSTGFTPSLANAITVVPILAGSPVKFIDSPLDPGAYYYDCRPFTNDGKWDALTGEITATVL